MAAHGEVVLRQRVCLAANAARCSSSARTVIADSAIAAPPAAAKPGSSSAAAPTAATSRVRKAGSIIATGSGNTARRQSASARDGSGFPFDHFSGIIRMWTAATTPVQDSDSIRQRWRRRWPELRPVYAALPGLRPQRPLH